jgi:23S rRNA pseudouridine2605 synthase
LTGERLQKVLSGEGLASRRQAEDWIRAGRITVNGQAALLGQRVSPGDIIRIDGRAVRLHRPAKVAAAAQLYLCHRSPGDDLRENFIPRLPKQSGRRFVVISPMPRIDGGLELVSADGQVAARVQRAVRSLASDFSVRIRGSLDPEHQAAVLRGELDDGTILKLESLEESEATDQAANRWYHLRVIGASGKDVRQLFERQGALVGRVMRTSLGPLKLTRDLSRGHFRRLTDEESLAIESPNLGKP